MAKVRLSVGTLLPTAVEPSTDGTAPCTIPTPKGSVSAVVPLILWCDTAGYQRAAGLTIPSPDPRVRLYNGVAWGQFGEGMTIDSAIGVDGFQCAMQVQGYSTDAGTRAFKMLVSQGSIEVATAGVVTLPFGAEAVSALDEAFLNGVGGFGAVLDAPLLLDTASLSYGGAFIDLPASAEGVGGADGATMYLVRALGTAAETPATDPQAVLLMFGRFGSTAESVLNADSGAMDIVSAPSGTVYYLTNTLASVGGREAALTRSGVLAQAGGNYTTSGLTGGLGKSGSVQIRVDIIDSTSGSVVSTPLAATTIWSGTTPYNAYFDEDHTLSVTATASASQRVKVSVIMNVTGGTSSTLIWVLPVGVDITSSIRCLLRLYYGDWADGDYSESGTDVQIAFAGSSTEEGYNTRIEVN